MALKVKIKNGTSGCCSCNETTGCTCNGGACALECRTKSSDVLAPASLCGFDEFIPSAQPKKYRKKEITGKLYPCTYVSAACIPPSYPSFFDGHFSGIVAGYPSLIVVDGYCNQVGITSAGLVRYKVNVSATYNGVPVSGLIVFDNSEITDQTIVERAVVTGPWSIQLALRIGATTVRVGVASVIGVLGFDARRDNWSTSIQINKLDCTEESSAGDLGRYITVFCSSDEPGVHENPQPFMSIAGPAAAMKNSPVGGVALYNPLLYTQETAPTSRITTASGCIVDGLNSFSLSGEVVEGLTDEDTEQDAIARAQNDHLGDPLEWSAPITCDETTTAFIIPRAAGVYAFAFRELQSRVILNSVLPGRDYEVTMRYFRRLVGGSGDFAHFANVIYTITTPNPLDTTPGRAYVGDWVTAENEGGWETRAGNCSVRLLP